MKKFVVLMLALVLTGTAVADVDVNCAQVPDTCDVEIYYEASDDANRPRAFGLDITVDNGATITAIKSENEDYWVHPTNIQISGGVVTDEGDAEADPCDAPSDTQGGIDTGGLTIEMGSLYDPCDPCHPDPPANSGTLITITVSGDCNVSIKGNAARGKIVLEDASDAETVTTVTYTGCQVVTAEPECFPSDHPDYAQWVLVGKPDCWCYPRQCYGDAHNDYQGKGKYWVFTNDLSTLKNAWQQVNYDEPGICADFAHDPQGKGNYRVFTNDLAILKTYWQQADGPAGDCYTGPPYPNP